MTINVQFHITSVSLRGDSAKFEVVIWNVGSRKNVYYLQANYSLNRSIRRIVWHVYGIMPNVTDEIKK